MRELSEQGTSAQWCPMALLGLLCRRAGWLRRFSSTGRAREPKPFFRFAPIYSEAPDPGFCAPRLPCPPQRCEGPKKQGPGKYFPGLTASMPSVASDLRNQSDPAELQISIACA